MTSISQITCPCNTESEEKRKKDKEIELIRTGKMKDI